MGGMYLRTRFTRIPTYADVPSDTSPRSLNDLPAELLLQIVSSVDLHRSKRILGHIPDDPPPSLPDVYLINDFLECSKPLCSLALASRRFRDMAQEFLLSAPIIGGCVFCNKQIQTTSRLAYLLRTLYARPDLRRHVRQIRLCYLERTYDFDTYRVVPDGRAEHESNMRAQPLDFAGLLRQSRDLIVPLDLSRVKTDSWGAQLDPRFGYDAIGIIMTLLPQLECLSLSEQNPGPVDLVDGLDMISIRQIQVYIKAGMGLQGLQSLPIANFLRHLKISSMFPLCLEGLDVFPNLDTLDLALKLAGWNNLMVLQFGRMFDMPTNTTNFSRIQHLRLDCQTKTAGIWDFSARVSMTHVLQAFQNLVSLDLYAEPSHEKNPFRSVRAFPHYQANIQTYPDEPTSTDRDATLGSVWDERVYDARTEWTDYQHLVDSLVHIRPKLQSLKLPGGFWTLPGAMRKPLPSFTSFPELQRLVLPQAAILSIKLDNMRYPETEHADFELLPLAVLPSSVQQLKIFDADARLLQSTWLQELLDEQAGHNYWPELRTVEILFGPAFDDLELEKLTTRESWEHFWTLADKCAFQVLLGRDDEVPSICD
jgi:hypothetical protein